MLSAFCYTLALLLTTYLLRRLAQYNIDELKTDYKNPINPCNTLNPLVPPSTLSSVSRVFEQQSGFHWSHYAPPGIPYLEVYE